MSSEFEKYRASRVERLLKHIEDRLVDEGLVGWLLRINEFRCLVTTSSCSGRITLHEGSNPLDKRLSRIIYSWHDPASFVREICGEKSEALIKVDGVLVRWFSLQPPIIHLVTPSLDIARGMIQLAIENGMRRSCIRPSRHGWLVEVKAGDKSIYYVGDTLDCSFMERLAGILSEYKKRMFMWMGKTVSFLADEC